MAFTSKPVDTNRIARGRDDQGVSVPALRHAGPTLESDPDYPDTDQEDQVLTPEGQIAKVGASPDRTMGRGATDLSADVSSTDDAAKARRNRGPEALKTRLPGDTSSDPHTDLEAGNATTAWRRRE